MSEGVIKFRCEWTRHGAPGAGNPAAIVMGGHQDGLVVFGAGLDAAGEEVFRLLSALEHRSPP